MSTTFGLDSITIALDKGTARHTDANGFLHVDGCNISKATVNPYLGQEIPNWEALGLERDKKYMLLRPADELKKSAATFNNLPLMSKHIPLDKFNLEDPEVKKFYVGSTGTDAEFKNPYLINSLVIHTAGAIKDVEDEVKQELSCAYRYMIVMKEGTFEGEHYDGIMTNIEGNHVSLVTEGRAGHDVVVRDSMEFMRFRRVAALVRESLKVSPAQRLMDALGIDGDVPGHEFHGNQHVGGMGKISSTVGRMMSCVKGGDGHLVKDAGFTFSAQTREDVTKGISVGVHPERGLVIDPKNMSQKEMEKHTSQWLEKNADVLKDKSMKLGGWVDPKTGELCLDIVKIFPVSQMKQAMAAGSEHDQQAIANLSAIHKGDWDHAFISTGGTGAKMGTHISKAKGVVHAKA